MAEGARPGFGRALIERDHAALRHEALDFSESRLTDFLQFLRTDEERLYALLRAHPDNASVRSLALSAALLLKGRSVEEIRASLRRALHVRQELLRPQPVAAHPTREGARCDRSRWAAERKLRLEQARTAFTGGTTQVDDA